MIAMFNTAVTEEMCKTSLCYFCSGITTVLNLPDFVLSFQSCPFQNSSQQCFWGILIITSAKTKQQRSVYSAGQSAETQSIDQTMSLFRWTVASGFD